MQNPPDPKPPMSAIDPAVAQLIETQVKAAVAALQPSSSPPQATASPPAESKDIKRRTAELSRREADIASQMVQITQQQAELAGKLADVERREKLAKATEEAAEATVAKLKTQLSEAETKAAEAAREASAKIAELTAKLADTEAKLKDSKAAPAATDATSRSAPTASQSLRNRLDAINSKKAPQPAAAPAEPESAGAAPASLLEEDRPMPPLKHHATKRVSKKAAPQAVIPHFKILEEAGYENAEAQHALQSVLIAMNKATEPLFDCVQKKDESEANYRDRQRGLYNMELAYQIMEADELERRNKVVKDATLISSRIRREGGVPVADKPYLALFYLEPDAAEYVTSSMQRQVNLARAVAAVSAHKSAYGVAMMIDLLFSDLEAWKDGRPAVTFTQCQREAFMLIRGLHIRKDKQTGEERMEGPRYYATPGVLRQDGRTTLDELCVFGLRKAIWCGRASNRTKDQASDLLPKFPRVFVAFPGNEFCKTLPECLQVAISRDTPKPTLTHLQNHYNRYY